MKIANRKVTQWYCCIMGVWAARSVSDRECDGLSFCINGLRARRDFAQKSIVVCVGIVVVQLVAGWLTHQGAATQVSVCPAKYRHNDRAKAGFHRGTVGWDCHGVHWVSEMRRAPG